SSPPFRGWRRAEMRFIPPLALLLIAAVFAWLGASAITAPDEAASAPTRAPAPEAASPVALTLAQPARTDFAEVAARPLFSAVRRPPPPEAPGAPLADPNPHLLFGRYEIAGVVMLGEAAMAMLRDETGRLIRVRAGDTVETRSGAADVIEITMSALTFEEGGERVVAEVGGAEVGDADTEGAEETGGDAAQ
ncbi:MAG: hypothetical protein AAFP78_16905, partial [Pseudomonadota bacterium]